MSAKKTKCALCDRGMLAPHKHRDTLIDAVGLNELAEQIQEVKNLKSFKLDPLFDYFDFDIPPLEKES